MGQPAQVDVVGNMLEMRQVQFREIVFAKAERRRAEGVGLDRVRARAQVREMDIPHAAGPRKTEQVRAHAEIRTTEVLVAEAKVLYHRARCPIEHEHLCLDRLEESHDLKFDGRGKGIQTPDRALPVTFL